MEVSSIIKSYWADVAAQDAARLREYFLPSATVRWHNTNELLTVEEFIRANCEYPGDWCGEVERFETIDGGAVSVTRVWLADGSASFHATSFFALEGDRIKSLDEYWGDDGAPPQWRVELGVGKALRNGLDRFGI